MSTNVGERVEVPWGAGGTLALDLPAEWNVIGVLEPKAIPAVADAAVAIRESLAKPIGMAPLGEVARNARKVAIIVDDVSRPTPAQLLLPEVVAELAAAGVARDAITLVMALGTHRPMTCEEVAKK